MPPRQTASVRVCYLKVGHKTLSFKGTLDSDEEPKHSLSIFHVQYLIMLVGYKFCYKQRCILHKRGRHSWSENVLLALSVRPLLICFTRSTYTAFALRRNSFRGKIAHPVFHRFSEQITDGRPNR